MSWLFGDSLSGNNYEDPLGEAGSKFQRYTDPLAMIFGQKYIDLTSKRIPTEVNRALSSVVTPIDKASSYIDPLYSQTAGIHNWVNHKPGSTIGAVVGSAFAAPALGSAAGFGGGAGAAGADAAGAGAATGAGGGASSLFGLGGGLGADAGGAGASGLTGFFSGPAAYGDAGLTGTVSAGGSGLGSVMGGDLGGALGSSPTGLFSGLLPGGGMTGTASGALGGGISGDTAGLSGIGGASMGGFNMGGLTNFAQQVLQQQSQLAQQRANQANQQNQQGNSQYSAGPPPTAILLPPSYTPSRQAVAQSPQQSLLGHMMLQQMGGYGPYGGY